MAANLEVREAFLSRWPPSEGLAPGSELDQALQAALESTRAAWPQLALSAEAFATFIADRVDTGVPSPAEAINKMHMGDLGLCFASMQGLPAALAALDQQIDQLGGIIGRIDGSPAFVDEVKQVMRVDLLVGREGSTSERRPKIVQYRGKAPLRAWLRVIATRVAIAIKNTGNAASEVESLDELIAVAAAEDPELEHLRGRHLGEFRTVINQAVSDVLAELDVEGRNLLRWHLVDNLSLRKIAVVRGDNVSAVSRQYALIRAFLMDRVRQRLKEHTGLPTRDLNSVMAALRSQISLSLSSCALLDKPGPVSP